MSIVPNQPQETTPPPEPDTESVPSRCTTCDGPLFHFEPPNAVKPFGIDRLPTVCRRCGQICIEGQPVRKTVSPSLPVPEQAARSGRVVREQLLTDPEAGVEKYFAGVYRSAYLEGFVRALAHFTHSSKEGRLARLRRLWAPAEIDDRSTFVEIRMTHHEFREFKYLLEMTVSSQGAHAQDPSNADAAGPAR